ncbi:hypothetical protein BRC81_07490 [Halobacteriales archaeon QS_1_68_20]|nr:MAG: hypothetical protein BRC81_07490 [Halobacteriales archaeon QS_1_68_20]
MLDEHTTSAQVLGQHPLHQVCDVVHGEVASLGHPASKETTSRPPMRSATSRVPTGASSAADRE